MQRERQPLDLMELDSFSCHVLSLRTSHTMKRHIGVFPFAHKQIPIPYLTLPLSCMRRYVSAL